MYFDIGEKKLFYNRLQNRSDDWQDIINIIENNTSIQDIQSWDDFYENKTIFNLLEDFIRIVNCNPKPLTFNNLIIKEIFIIAEYFNGKYQKNEIKDDILSNLGKLLLLTVGITQLENIDNQSNYICDLRLWTQYNIFQLLNLDSVCKEKHKIMHFLNTIHIEGIERYQETLINNIDQKEILINFKLLEQNKDKVFNVDAFNYNTLKLTSEKSNIMSWQENILLDMLMIKISNNEIIPLFDFGYITNPDISCWTPEVLNVVKETTNCEISDFIVETIGFMKNNTIPSHVTINRHIDLFLNNLKKQKLIYNKYNNSSFFILKKLIKEKVLDHNEKSKVMKELVQVKDAKEIEYLNNVEMIISKEQQEILKNYIIHQIDDINTISEFSDCLSKNKNNKDIDNKWISKCHEKFYQLIQGDLQLLECPKLFIDYMLFLINIKQYEHLDKKIINCEMIKLKKTWEEIYFYLIDKNLSTIIYQEKISNEQIERFNDINFLVDICMITSYQQYVDFMEIVSENSLFNICFNNIYINPFFPTDYREEYNVTKNDIDKCVLEIIKNIKKQRIFLNSIDDLQYLRSINQSMMDNAKYAFTIFNNTESLYLEIQRKLTNYMTLIDYHKEPKLAHLTQLFPIIEMLIQKIGIHYNIFPFKETKGEEFIKFKDSSSILRQILETKFKEYQTFEHNKDLLFVYHYLYNSHSLNIRNECVHGRNYLSGDSLVLAFKITLSSLYLLINHLDKLSK